MQVASFRCCLAKQPSSCQDASLSFLAAALGADVFDYPPVTHGPLLDADDFGVYVAIEAGWPWSKLIDVLSAPPQPGEIVDSR